MKKITLFTIFSFLVSGTIAQDRISVQEAVATALQNNFDIQLSKNDSILAALDYKYRDAALLPAVTATAGTTWNRNNQQLRFDKRSGSGDSAVNRDAVKTHNVNYALNLNWVLFDGLKMFITRDKAAAFQQLGDLRVREEIINTTAAVVTNYYDIVRQKQVLKSVEEQINLNEERVKLAQYKLDVGTGAKPDVLQSKVDLNAQRSLKLAQLTLIEQLKEQLNQLMNARFGTNFDVEDSIPLLNDIALGNIEATLETSNPTLLIAAKNIAIAEFSLREAKADRYPVVGFNAAYNFTQNDNNVAVNINQPFFNRNKGFNYGLTAALPIFNRFNIKKQILRSKLDIDYLQLSYESQRSALHLELQNAYKSYQLQKQTLLLEEENILLARENVFIVFEAYKLVAATLVQLREAQSSLEQANNRLIAARYATKLAETNLMKLQGGL